MKRIKHTMFFNGLGGVVPERASRKHLEVVHPLIREALAKAKFDFADLDYIAVSNLPGLLGSLLVGVTVAKGLAWSLDKPLIGVNHVESHPYANILAQGPWEFPVLHLVVAGGHTLLLRADDHFHYTILGRTMDDAAGECVDKVAKMFGHPMPGGPVVDRYALEAPGDAFAFPRPLLNKPVAAAAAPAPPAPSFTAVSRQQVLRSFSSTF